MSFIFLQQAFTQKSKGRLIYLIVVIVLLSFIFFAKKMHLDHFFMGKSELSKLTLFESSSKIKPRHLVKFIYVAHAGGGYKGKSYLNNLEALDNSYKLGLDFIEIDLNYSKDSIVVLSHDFVDKTASEFLLDKTHGTHLSMDDFLLWLKDKNVYIITDIKANNLKVLQDIINRFKIESEKIIPQVYTISEIIEAKKMGYHDLIYTNYISLYPNSIILDLAKTESLFGITLPYDTNFKILEYFENFKAMETPIFTHSLNDPKSVSQLMQEGCSGVYTDFLLLSSD